MPSHVTRVLPDYAQCSTTTTVSTSDNAWTLSIIQRCS
jgi:hypothetical protein